MELNSSNHNYRKSIIENLPTSPIGEVPTSWIMMDSKISEADINSFDVHVNIMNLRNYVFDNTDDCILCYNFAYNSINDGERRIRGLRKSQTVTVATDTDYGVFKTHTNGLKYLEMYSRGQIGGDITIPSQISFKVNMFTVVRYPVDELIGGDKSTSQANILNLNRNTGGSLACGFRWVKDDDDILYISGGSLNDGLDGGICTPLCGTVSAGDMYVVSASYDIITNESTLRINGQTISTTASVYETIITTGNHWVGEFEQNGPTYLGVTDIFEQSFYVDTNAVNNSIEGLTFDQITQWEDYLKDKWGITY
jgi:hypothetical protein